MELKIKWNKIKIIFVFCTKYIFLMNNISNYKQNTNKETLKWTFCECLLWGLSLLQTTVSVG